MKKLTTKESITLAEKLKELGEKYGISDEKLKKAAVELDKATVELDGSKVEALISKSVDEKKEKKEEPKKPQFEGTRKFITLGGYFEVEQGVYSVIKRNVQKCVNTLLLGPTGVGKTELVANVAVELGLPLTIFDMGTMTDPIMSLVGTHVIKTEDGHTTSTFAKSRFSEVIQKPGIVLLDELSRASATANNLLFPCLDFRRELSMEYCFENTDPVKVHPQCVFFATANLGGQYTGAHKLDRALLDRFMIMEIDPLGTKEVKKAISKHCPSIETEKVNKVVDIYQSINASHDEFKISFSLSIRHLKMIAEMITDGFTVYDSFYVICKGIGGEDGLKALESILSTAREKKSAAKAE